LRSNDRKKISRKDREERKDHEALFLDHTLESFRISRFERVISAASAWRSSRFFAIFA
jgi:hypothetical protein